MPNIQLERLRVEDFEFTVNLSNAALEGKLCYPTRYGPPYPELQFSENVPLNERTCMEAAYSHFAPDKDKAFSAFVRLRALTCLVKNGQLNEWIDPAGAGVHKAVIIAAASAPCDVNKGFRIAPFRILIQKLHNTCEQNTK